MLVVRTRTLYYRAGVTGRGCTWWVSLCSHVQRSSLGLLTADYVAVPHVGDTGGWRCFETTFLAVLWCNPGTRYNRNRLAVHAPLVKTSLCLHCLVQGNGDYEFWE